MLQVSWADYAVLGKLDACQIAVNLGLEYMQVVLQLYNYIHVRLNLRLAAELPVSHNTTHTGL